MQTFVVVTFSGKGILFLMPSNVNYFARLGDKASASVGNTSQIHEHMALLNLTLQVYLAHLLVSPKDNSRLW